jgi:FAD/FMN-containing dehydrogenase
MLLDHTNNQADLRELNANAVRDLESHFLGQVIRPDDIEFEHSYHAWNTNYRRRPALVTRPADAADVIRAVGFARDQGLELAIRSGGHSLGGYSTVENGLVLDLSLMRGMSIDAQRRVAWAQPGLTWGTYTEMAQEHGLVTPAGDSPTVGLGGLTLGGGIGYLARKHGMTIDHLISAELVTADGRLIRASREERPDLFWALRGGGGNFGVVTAFQFKLQPLNGIVGGPIVFPATPNLIRSYLQAAFEAPEELTTITFVLPAPPLPFVPEEFVGKPVVVIAACYAGEVEAGLKAVEPLRKLGKPVVDLMGPMPYAGLYALAEAGSPYLPRATRSVFTDVLDASTREAMVEFASETPVMGGLVQIRPLGGAMARVPNDATAFAHRDAKLMVLAESAWSEPHEAEQATARVERLYAGLRRHARGVYVNFLAREGQARIREAYPNGTYERLAAIKRAYDPRNLFRGNQNIIA